MKQGTHHDRTRSKKPSASKGPQESNPSKKLGINGQNLFEKYTNLAREALIIGDRILAEGHYQLAEHYLRITSQFKENTAASLPKKSEPTLPVPNHDFERLIEQELSAHVSG